MDGKNSMMVKCIEKKWGLCGGLIFPLEISLSHSISLNFYRLFTWSTVHVGVCVCVDWRLSGQTLNNLFLKLTWVVCFIGSRVTDLWHWARGSLYLDILSMNYGIWLPWVFWSYTSICISWKEIYTAICVCESHGLN